MAYEGVTSFFTSLVANVQLTSAHIDDASGKHHRVRSALNRHYWGTGSDTANSFLIGSYGKDTAIKPPSDIDILFQLPDGVYQRFSQRYGNVQSQLLQEIRDILRSTFPNTSIKGDGQIVSVPFTTYAVEVLPAFVLENGQYLYPDSNASGRWRITDPRAELASLRASNQDAAGKTVHLIKLTKAWKRSRNAKIKPLVIELGAKEFLNSWQHRATAGCVYYDYMMRDFFAYLTQHPNCLYALPGTSELIPSGDEWLSQATLAANASQEATRLGYEDRLVQAKAAWRRVFGDYLPA